MQRVALWVALLAVALLWLCGGVGAQEEGAAEPGAAAAAAPAGDPIWRPSREQLSRWVANGILAAELAMYLYDLPATLKWLWTSEEGTDLPGERKLKFVALMAPELAATAAGYAAAWDEGTWERIQADREPVVEELVSLLMPAFDGRQVYFALGITGQAFADAAAAVYYDGEWRDVGLTRFGGLSQYVEEELAPDALSARWAAGYLIGQSLDDPAFAALDDLRVYVGIWYSRPDRKPSEALVNELETPSGFGKDTIRFAVGTAEGHAYTDFGVGP